MEIILLLVMIRKAYSSRINDNLCRHDVQVYDSKTLDLLASFKDNHTNVDIEHSNCLNYS